MQVTEAIRDATVSGRKVKKGQTIVLDPDDGLLAVDNDPQKAVLAGARAARARATACSRSTTARTATLDDAEALGAQGPRGARPGVEDVEVVHGGQPHYRYLDLRRVSASAGGPAPASGSRSLRPQGRGAGAARPRRAPRVAGRAVGDPAGRAACAGSRRRLGVDTVRDLLFHLPAPLRRPARAADARRPPRPRRRDASPRRGSRVIDIARPADLAAPRPGHDRARSPTGPASPTATWFGRRFIERRVATGRRAPGLGQDQAPPRRARLRGPGVPAGRRREPAPRRADRARLPAHDRPDGEPAARRRCGWRSTAAGHAYPEYLPRGDPRPREDAAADRARPSRPPTTRPTFEARDAALRRLAFDELLALQLGMVARRRARGRARTLADRRWTAAADARIRGGARGVALAQAGPSRRR